MDETQNPTPDEAAAPESTESTEAPAETPAEGGEAPAEGGEAPAEAPKEGEGDKPAGSW